MSDSVVLSGESLAAQVIGTMAAPESTPSALCEEEDSGARFSDFDESFQTKIAALCLRDSDFVARTEGLLKPEYFERQIEACIVSIALNYFKRYRRTPDVVTLNVLIRDAVVGKVIRSDLVPELREALSRIMTADISDVGFAVDKVEEFAQQRAWEMAITRSVTHLGKRDFEKIKKEIEQAGMVAAGDDLEGYDYFASVEQRTILRNERAAGILPPKGITTGIRALDEALYHGGWGRRELSVLMGAAKSGKSMALLEFSKNAALKGYNVLYVTLEVDSEVLADRLDANLTNYMMRELTHKGREAEEQVKRAAAAAGKLMMHRYPPGTVSPNDVHRLIQRYRAKGILFDLIAVDYGDLMVPDFRTRDNPIEDSKNVWTGLRKIAGLENLAMLSATQTNRDGARASVAKATDVADDFNKIRIADIVISINRTDEEKKRNEARLHFAASRNQGDDFSLRINQDLERGRFITKILGAV